jgi:hypothetical protein
MRKLPFLAVALLVGTPGHAEDPTGAVVNMFSRATPATPGCGVAASHQGKAGGEPRLRAG